MLEPSGVRVRAAALRHSHPSEALAWAAAEFRGRVALTVSFGGPGVALAHMLAGIDRTVPVIFGDTGLLFDETYAHRRAFADRYGLTVIDVTPESDPGALYETDPDACCGIRKVEPMRKALGSFDAWISAIRRDQGPTRVDTEVLEYHEIDGHPLVKVHPLAFWTRRQVWRYIGDNEIPYNPLLDQGYSSLGCWPCTRRTHAGESERAGRWSGWDKMECGLHTFTAPRGEP